MATSADLAMARRATEVTAQKGGWTMRWVSDRVAELQKGSTGTDLVFGPFMPHQVATVDLGTAPDGSIQVVLRQAKARWYGGGKTEPRKAKKDFDGLASALAQELTAASPQFPATSEPFRD